MQKRKALITGITGMDGSHLAEYLISKGYDVSGIIRRVALQDQETRTSRINHIKDKIELIPCDLNNYGGVFNAIQKSNPDECYHLAAQSFVGQSFKDPWETYSANFGGTVNILEALKTLSPKCKFYFAATSELYGKVLATPQDENTPFNPRSPYAIAKLGGYFATKLARNTGMFACSGILFNHSGPRRGLEFVTQKIVMGLNDVKKGKKEWLELGNIDARRDIGFSGDYVKAMHLMLQQTKPDDYVISSGTTHSIREFAELTAKRFGYDLSWKGIGVNEIGYDTITGKNLIRINPEFYRPAEVELLHGDHSKATKILGWKPETNLDDLIDMMVDAVK